MNDRLYPSGLYGDTINQTLQRTYAGSERETLLDSSTFNFEYSITVNGNPARRVLDSQIDYYFDKQTGVCVEQREQTTITDPATNYTETTVSLIELKQTNLWAVPESPTLTISALTLLIITLAAVLHKSKPWPKNNKSSGPSATNRVYYTFSTCQQGLGSGEYFIVAWLNDGTQHAVKVGLK